MIAAVCSLTLFSNIAFPLYRFLRTNFQFEETTGILLISVIFLAATLLIYQLLKQLIDKVFIREEIARSETLKEFSTAVIKKLKNR